MSRLNSLVHRRRRVIGIAAAGIAAPILGPWKRRAHAADAPITLKLAHPDTTLHPVQKVAVRFAKLVEERTNGAIRIRVFPGDQLGSQTNIVSGLTTGIVDITIHTAGSIGTMFPRVQAVDLPFLFKDVTAAEGFLAGPVGQGIMNGMAADGVYGLTWGHYGWREVETTDRPIHDPKDMNGFRIRVQASAIFTSMFKAVGAIPIVLTTASEIYIGLSQNMVSGIDIPVIAYVSSKSNEVTKFISMTNHVYNAGMLMVSKAKLDSLDPKHQTVIRETAAEMQPFWRKNVADTTNESIKFCEEKGIKINETDYAAFAAAMQPVYAEFRAKLGGDFIDDVLKAVHA
jgi:tripartite ATP-independent transporter DctP family solute receptor